MTHLTVEHTRMLEHSLHELITLFNEVKNTEFTTASQITMTALVEALPDALLVVDSNGKIVLVNAQSELLFGRSRNELVTILVDDLLPERYREQHKKHRENYKTSPKTRPMGFDLPLYALHKSGAEIGVVISVSPLITASGLFVLALLRRRVG